MKIKSIISITAVVLLLFLCSIFVGADKSIFINDGSSVLRGLFSENYAIGAGGTALLDYDDVYVLSKNGLSSVSSMNAEGGGGLLYDDGEVEINSEIIKVGLSFNYNGAGMDTTVEEAYFSNLDGEGFLFGYFDDDREFVELDQTDEDTIYIFSLDPDTDYLGVYDGDGDLIYETAHPNTKNNFLAVCPASEDSLTRYNGGNRYFGGFELGYTAGDGITVINTVPLEQYLVGVILAEMPASSTLEAYKAQAVAARTYAQKYIMNTDLYDYYGFDLTDTTYHQAYYGYFVPSGGNYSTASAAVEETENEYLTYRGSLISAMYCAANGGMTADGGVPYLKSFEDPYEGAAWTKGAYGHGCGMSQWGAYAMAKYYNKDYKSILGFYYTQVGISYGYL